MTVDKSSVSCSAESHWKRCDSMSMLLTLCGNSFGGKSSKLHISSYTRIKITKTVYACMVCCPARSPANSENALVSVEHLHFFCSGTSMQKRWLRFHSSPQHFPGCVMLVAGSAPAAAGLAWLTSWFLCYRNSYGARVFCIKGNWPGWCIYCRCWISILESHRNKPDLTVCFFPHVLSVEL